MIFSINHIFNKSYFPIYLLKLVKDINGYFIQMDTPNVQYIEHIIEVSSLDRDVDKYPNAFHFQVPLKDNYRFVVKVELLQASFYLPSASTDSSSTDSSSTDSSSTDCEDINPSTYLLTKDEMETQFQNIENLYLTIDELQKGNFESSNTVINNSFCSFKRLVKDEKNFYDHKNYTFPHTVYSVSAPLSGLNKLTCTIHPNWVNKPFPFCSITKTYKEAVSGKKKKYITNIDNQNTTKKNEYETTKKDRDRNWGRLNYSLDLKSIDENVLYNLATENNYKKLDLSKQVTLVFKITCMVPISGNSSLNARIQFM